MIIAIDGHAGSGKTTVSKILAKKLGMLHVNTGAMYRAATFFCINNNISPTASFTESNSLLDMDIEMKLDGLTEKEAFKIADESCRKLLANPNTETYKFELVKD